MFVVRCSPRLAATVAVLQVQSARTAAVYSAACARHFGQRRTTTRRCCCCCCCCSLGRQTDTPLKRSAPLWLAHHHSAAQRPNQLSKLHTSNSSLLLAVVCCGPMSFGRPAHYQDGRALLSSSTATPAPPPAGTTSCGARAPTPLLRPKRCTEIVCCRSTALRPPTIDNDGEKWGRQAEGVVSRVEGNRRRIRSARVWESRTSVTTLSSRFSNARTSQRTPYRLSSYG